MCGVIKRSEITSRSAEKEALFPSQGNSPLEFCSDGSRKHPDLSGGKAQLSFGGSMDRDAHGSFAEGAPSQKLPLHLPLPAEPRLHPSESRAEVYFASTPRCKRDLNQRFSGPSYLCVELSGEPAKATRVPSIPAPFGSFLYRQGTP